ncbi:MAG TPA: polyprenol phosphomannose-dependent alpha 1,6 mannosyltransferase MptB [Amycolatopsis sp.]|uniref:polyprenol phosphomannose-dependent alpha 1,6 mannosyltransferase MptB n=1 Tax=Amycolatopsis sp. TaxID=37632 RepID=UPI002B48D24C|nr:polyprenol phosphomannose-dependent alpha 1,6 mannosyltransferase MptB [Amycolatopsis sp.]HKS46331.1 polyprenol phosphomannose-dependent alpha 1,6 mannosyltransferase MptB [Amycolatopsis sp.]
MSVRLPVTTWSASVAGFVGVAVLVLATSGFPGPSVVLLTVGLTGMGVVVLAWLGLGRRAAEIPVRGLYWIAVAWCLPLLFARPLFSGDVRSYLAQGVIAAQGLDPYRLGPMAALGASSPVAQEVSHYWQDTPAPYGPVWIAISRAIARIAGQDLLLTLLLNRLVELAGVTLIAWALPRLARRMGVSPGIAVWLGLLNPLVLWHVVAGAHNDGLMVGLVLAGMEIALGGLSGPSRLVSGFVLLTVAANIKIVAGAAVCCLGAALARRWGRTAGRGALVMLGVFVGFVVLSVVISAVTSLGWGWLGTLGASAQVHSWLAPTNQLGFLVGGLGALAGADITSAAISVTVRVGAVLGAIAGAGMVWAIFRGRWNPLTGLGLVFAVMLATGPVVQPWYLLWAIVPLAASLRSDRARRPLVVISAVSAMLLPPISGGAAVLVAGYLGAAVLLAMIWLGGCRGKSGSRTFSSDGRHRSSSTKQHAVSDID